MGHQIPLDASARAAEHENDGVRELAPDLAYQRLAIVNVAYFGRPEAGDGGWVLIDAGVMGTTGQTRSAVEARFNGARPGAIILTHGHFDHVGALEELSAEWNVPVYAHDLEHPYLNGSASYPPPDPSVGGGMMAALSPLYPRGPVNVGERLLSLPEDGSLPLMAGWRWLHTPGHTPGHVSLWHPERRLLIAGDAFITTRQESAYAALTQEPELHGPPMYYTQDWDQAEQSVRMLANLAPEVAVTGHGRAMQGAELRGALETLARDFRRIAVPEQGRYVEQPARVEDSTAYRKAS